GLHVWCTLAIATGDDVSLTVPIDIPGCNRDTTTVVLSSHLDLVQLLSGVAAEHTHTISKVPLTDNDVLHSVAIHVRDCKANTTAIGFTERVVFVDEGAGHAVIDLHLAATKRRSNDDVIAAITGDIARSNIRALL